METTRLSTKGQIILPKAIRETRAWGPGTEFVVEEAGDGVFLRPVPQFQRTKLEDVVGCLPYEGKPKSDAQMRAAVRRQVSKRHARGRY